MPDGTTASFSTSLGLQPSLKAGLKGSVLWSVASGEVLQQLSFDCFIYLHQELQGP